MCDDASHGDVINAAYEFIVSRLIACRKDFYVKKQVNSIAGYLRNCLSLNTIQGMQLGIDI